MTEGKGFISIWFFIGALLAAYGVLILGSGLFGLVSPSAGAPPAPGEIPRNVMAHLHAEIWWGALLVILGGIYCIKFWPKKGQ